LWVLVCCLCLLSEASERRRRIKKKVIKSTEEAGPELETSDSSKSNADMKPKEPRGFLDDYYKQFEARTEKVGLDQVAQETLTVPRGFVQDNYPGEQELESAERRQDATELELENLLMKERQLQELLARESELTSEQREELLRQLAAWPEQKHDVSSFHHQQTLQNLVDPMNNDVTLLQGDYQRIKKHTPTYQADFAGVFPNLLTNSITNSFDSEENEISSESALHHERATGYQSYSAPSGANKYLGVTATSSQDIQLGLTFTVPFLSIPLASINNLIGGNFADIGNFLNFGDIDIGSIATVAVIGIAAIFVLPQAIYWITGINLSTFNWGRSDDDVPGIVGLANTVDHALHEFNIDGKGCMAKSMCDILYGDDSEQRGMIVKAIANSASKNANMKAYLGETKFKMLEEFGAIKEKYGSQPTKCENVFQSVCPWDSVGMSSIFMKLMASQGTNLAEMALKAASAAATS